MSEETNFLEEPLMAYDSDSYDDDDDDERIIYDNPIKEQGEGTNATVQHSMKHYQPTNKILSKYEEDWS